MQRTPKKETGRLPKVSEFIAMINGMMVKQITAAKSESECLDRLESALKDADAHLAAKLDRVLYEHADRRQKIAHMAHRLADCIGRLPPPADHDESDALPRVLRSNGTPKPGERVQ